MQVTESNTATKVLQRERVRENEQPAGGGGAAAVEVLHRKSARAIALQGELLLQGADAHQRVLHTFLLRGRPIWRCWIKSVLDVPVVVEFVVMSRVRLNYSIERPALQETCPSGRPLRTPHFRCTFTVDRATMPATRPRGYLLLQDQLTHHLWPEVRPVVERAPGGQQLPRRSRSLQGPQ